MIQVGLLLLLCILTVNPASVAARANYVPCLDNMEAVANFNTSQFAGIWYEVRNYYPILGKEERCVATKYTLTEDGSYDVVFGRVVGKTPETMTAKIKKAGGPTEGKLASARPGLPDKIYIIFNVVYDKFFGVYSCTDGSTDVSIFARARTIEDAAFASATAILAKYPTLKQNVLKVVDQAGCTNVV